MINLLDLKGEYPKHKDKMKLEWLGLEIAKEFQEYTHYIKNQERKTMWGRVICIVAVLVAVLIGSFSRQLGIYFNLSAALFGALSMAIGIFFLVSFLNTFSITPLFRWLWLPAVDDKREMIQILKVIRLQKLIEEDYQ